MGSGNSGLYHGATAGTMALRMEQQVATLTATWNGKEWVTKETKPPKEYQGGRSRREYSDLARDPARGTRVDDKGRKERGIALDLEKQGKLGKVVRDPLASKGADFIDTVSGQKWCIAEMTKGCCGNDPQQPGCVKSAFFIRRGYDLFVRLIVCEIYAKSMRNEPSDFV